MQWRNSLLSLALAGALSSCGTTPEGGSTPPPTPPGTTDPVAYKASVSAAAGKPDSRLACYQGKGEPECNLRIYEVMVEAFVDGDSTADYGTGYGTSHHRGDLQGIINSLDYIQSTGVNALWLTPVFTSVRINGQDHWADRLDATGYYPSDYFNVDPKFGSNAKLKELVDAAHARGLYVFLDGVFGHFKTNAKDYPSPTGRTVTNTNGQASYPADLEFFKEVASYWVREYKVDGWRLDVAYQVPVQYWDDVRAAVAQAAASVTYTHKSGQPVHPLGYMVGEIWSGAGDIASQGYGPADSPGLLSAFDFPLRYTLVQTLAVEESGNGNRPASYLNTGFLNHLAYPPHAMPNLMLTNHDVVRFGDLIQRGGLAEPTHNSYWERHKAAFSFLAAYSGPITLYYGDEVGQEVPGFSSKVSNTTCAVPGLCDDHVARTSALIPGVPTTVGAAPTVLTPEQLDLKNHVAALMALREAHPALANGSRTHIFSDSSVYMDRKDKGDDHVLYVLNTKGLPAVLTVAASAIGSAGELVDLRGGATVTPANGVYEIALKPFEARFLDIVTPTAEGPQGNGNSSLTGTGPLAACDAPTVAGLGPLNKEMYIRGTYAGGNTFSATPATRRFAYKGNNIYQVVVNEPSATAYTFKFASPDWSSEFAVQDSAPVVIATEQPMTRAAGSGTESALVIPEPGDYVFSFRLVAGSTSGQLMVSKCP